MSQGPLKLRWELSSGIWQSDEKIGYRFLGDSKQDISRNIDPILCKQFFNLPFLKVNNKVFPPEFLYDPDSGVKLTVNDVEKADYWLAPYGYSASVMEEAAVSSNNGLQLSDQLKQLKTTPKSISDVAEQEIQFPLAGLFEFFSVKANTTHAQLFAYNKTNGSLSLYAEHSEEWLEIKAAKSRMAACPTAMYDHWKMLGFQINEKEHQMYIPTVEGLACLTINALALSYTVHYHTIQGMCLSSPVFWQKCILVVMLVENEVCIVDILNGKKIPINSHQILNTPIYFEKAVYDSSQVIWVGENGQLVLSIDINHELSAEYDLWRGCVPDFRFGAPYRDNAGRFYQLMTLRDETKGLWGYIQLNDQQQLIQPTSVRFTTGHEKYSFEDKISGDIWEESLHSVENKKMTVPVIEDKKKQLVLGFIFDSESNRGITEILKDKSMQDIILFMDSHSVFQRIHRVRVKEPLTSRFFYHKNHLYFYNPSLKVILGWEAQK